MSLIGRDGQLVESETVSVNLPRELVRQVRNEYIRRHPVSPKDQAPETLVRSVLGLYLRWHFDGDTVVPSQVDREPRF